MVTAPPRTASGGASSYWMVQTAMTFHSTRHRSEPDACARDQPSPRSRFGLGSKGSAKGIVGTRVRAVQQSCLLRMRRFYQNGSSPQARGQARGLPLNPARWLMDVLSKADPDVWQAIQDERRRQQHGLEMIASENY